MRNVHVFNIGIICIHGEELLRQLAFHQKHKRSHNGTNVRHICEIGVRTRWDLRSENNWLGTLFMDVFIFGWWWTSHQSHAHTGLRILRFCIMSWKGEREPKVKHCMGRQIEVVQKFTKIQSFGQNWWWANGIRIVRSSVVSMELKLYEWFLPMNTDACNVEECLSLSFVASVEDWFCFYRTWSFTLCKNDLDSNDMSDSASV